MTNILQMLSCTDIILLEHHIGTVSGIVTERIEQGSRYPLCLMLILQILKRNYVVTYSIHTMMSEVVLICRGQNSARNIIPHLQSANGHPLNEDETCSYF